MYKLLLTLLLTTGLSYGADIQFKVKTLPDLQTKEDVNQNCGQVFKQSSAQNSCTTLEAWLSRDGKLCTIEADCKYQRGKHDRYRVARITLPLSEVSKLNNCQGYLTTDPC